MKVFEVIFGIVGVIIVAIVGFILGWNIRAYKAFKAVKKEDK